jgi:hypothetical protein
MNNIYCFLAGLLVAFILLRGWQPQVGRYEAIIVQGAIAKADTSTGQIWLAAGDKWTEIAPAK